MMHYVLSRDDIVKTFVIENMVDGKMQVTDFFSIMRTTQKCINPDAIKKGYETMYFGMMFYYGLSQNTLGDILKQAQWAAKDHFQCDSFNIMCIMGLTEELMKE